VQSRQRQSGRKLMRRKTASSENNATGGTSAVGLEETMGHLRARRTSLFTQTVIWMTVLVCGALLLGTIAQAWSNSQLAAKVQQQQQALQQDKKNTQQLKQKATYYQNPSVIESEARQQLGYVRPGEQPILIEHSSSPAQPVAPTVHKQQTLPQQGFWQSWWHIFWGP
jgi:cell division protein FtsB